VADDLERLVAAVCAGGTDGIDELEAIAKRRPEALRPYHRRLLDAEAWWPEVLFRGMDEATSAYAVRLADEGAEHAVLLLELLAGCGSSTAVEAIRRWVREPPAWTAHLHWPVARYAHVGGWELADGEVRRLTRDATTRLVPVLGGGSPTTDQCRWCGRPWWRLLDLAPGGPLDLAERVAVGTCVGCGGFATLYGEYARTACTAGRRGTSDRPSSATPRSRWCPR